MPFIYILSIIVILLSLAYLGRRLYKAFKCVFPHCSKIAFWIVYPIFIIAIVYFKSALFGVIIFSILLFPLLDIIKYFIKKINLRPKLRRFCKNIYLKGFLAVVLALLLTGQALYVASAPVEKDYTAEISDPLESDYNIVYASDMHIGCAVTEKLIDEFVANANAKNPDLVCLGGDIFDESTSDYLFNYALNAFSRLESKYGVFYVYGNHEKMNDEARIKEGFESVGVRVLSDEIVLINNDFYLVGRLDKGQTGGKAAERKTLSELLEKTDPDKAVVLLDHQPVDIAEAERLGVDLQISGHTHDGQLFPMNLFIGMFNEVAYGTLTRGDYRIIVSSGYGTWGFPIRSGSRSETVNITMKSK